MDYTYERIGTNLDTPDWSAFAFFSANVQHVLQVYDQAVQWQYYEQAVQFTDQQAAADLSQGRAGTCGPVLRHALESPAFIVTFHYGFYRTVPVSLLSMGYRVVLLVSREVFESQRAFYAKALRPEWFANLVFLTAEDPQLFFKMRQFRRKGYQILCYADGGAGAKPRHKAGAEKTAQVMLGDAYIQARSGFAEMAYLLGTPLCLLMPPAEQPSRPFRLDSLEIYRPQEYTSRKQYVKNVLDSLYAHLGQHVIQAPHAWECWFYLHRTMPPKSCPEAWPVADRFIPFMQKQQGFLLDKGLYQVYPLAGEKFKKMLRLLCNSKHTF